MANSQTADNPTISAEQSAAPIWNVQELLERLEGDEELFRELIMLFQTDSRAELLKAKQALAEGDKRGLSRAAHTIRGMLRNLSMNAAAGIAAELEIAAQKELCQECPVLLEKLDRAVEEDLRQVEARLAR